MKKRLLCLTLMLIMVVSALLLVSCSSDSEDTDDTTDDSAKTITMWVVSENKISDEDEKLVETAFSEVTKSKFKVNVDIRFFTEDEYFEKLESNMKALEEKQKLRLECEELLNDAISEARRNGNTNKDAVREQFFNDHPEYAQFKSEMMNVGDDEEETSGSSTEDETVINEDYGIPEIKYPEADEDQVDIIYLAGYDRYISFVDNEWLAPLDEQLAGVASKLTSYISSTLLDGVKKDNTTYAIPNNVEIGKYTYMLLDKELVDEYPIMYKNVTSIVDCKSFIDDMLEYEPDVLPIASTYDECMQMLVWHWNIDYTSELITPVDENGDPILDLVLDKDGNPKLDKDGNYVYEAKKYRKYDYQYLTENKFNMIGVVYSSAKDAGRGKMNMSFNNLLADNDYLNILMTLKYYEYNNCYGELKEGQKAAISFMEGSYAVKSEADANYGVYTDENGRQYYPIIVKYPQAEEKDLYGSMFAVSAYSDYVTESMQVLTELNTSSTLKNILQYGVEGVHYELQTENPEISPVKRVEGCQYIMDINKTGNCFLAYPEEGNVIDYWDNVKNQNNDSLVDPLLGFDINKRLEALTFDEYNPEHLDNNLLKNVNNLSADIWAQIEACQTYEELKTLVYGTTSNSSESLVTLYGSTDKPTYGTVTVDLEKWMNSSWKGDEDGNTDAGQPLYTLYRAWCEEFGYWVTESEN